MILIRIIFIFEPLFWFRIKLRFTSEFIKEELCWQHQLQFTTIVRLFYLIRSTLIFISILFSFVVEFRFICFYMTFFETEEEKIRTLIVLIIIERR